MQSGRFGTLARPGKPSVDYPVNKLTKNLEKTDLMLFIGEVDALSQPGDVKILKSLLPKENPKTGKQTVYHDIKDYNHCDYMWAKNAHELVNIDLLDFINSRQFNYRN